MQLYRGMRIGTAVISEEERSGIPHHLIGIWPVTRQASVVEYRQAARKVIAHIRGQGGRPYLVGGSGLYVAATLDDLEFPGTDPRVRRAWQERLDSEGPAALHEELCRRDPEAAAAIDPGNGRRLVRALEVVEMTGSFRARLPDPPKEYLTALRIGLRSDPEVLVARIEARVHQMWRDGLPAEVAALLDEGLASGPTAGKAIGYAETIEYLAGRVGEQETIDTIIANTRRLARRQIRWFRRDPRIRWITVGPADSVTEIADRVVEQMAAWSGEAAIARGQA